MPQISQSRSGGRIHGADGVLAMQGRCHETSYRSSTKLEVVERPVVTGGMGTFEPVAHQRDNIRLIKPDLPYRTGGSKAAYEPTKPQPVAGSSGHELYRRGNHFPIGVSGMAGREAKFG